MAKVGVFLSPQAILICVYKQRSHNLFLSNSEIKSCFKRCTHPLSFQCYLTWEKHLTITNLQQLDVVTKDVQEVAVFSCTCPGLSPLMQLNISLAPRAGELSRLLIFFAWRHGIKKIKVPQKCNEIKMNALYCLYAVYLNWNNASHEIYTTTTYLNAEIFIRIHHFNAIVAWTIGAPCPCIPARILHLR